MKIIHVETGRHLYGGALQVLYLLRGLKAHSVDSVLISPRGSELSNAATREGLPVTEFSYKGEGDLASVWRLKRLFTQSSPDLVHLHSRRGADVWGLLAGSWAGLPVVVTRRVDNPEARWLAAPKYRLCQHVIAISKAIHNVLLAQGVPHHKLSLVYSAVDVAEWCAPVERMMLAREFNLNPQACLGAMVAQFIPRKGHRVLVEALAQLHSPNPAQSQSSNHHQSSTSSPPIVVLFGQGPLKNKVARWAESAGVSHLIRFAGFRRDLHKWLGVFDFCVHPVLREGLGVAALQAGAAAIPLVGTFAGGVPEVVVDGGTGLLVPPGDSTALAEALSRLANDPKRAAQMGRRAQERISTVFSPEAMVEGNLAVYRKVLG